MNDEESFWAGYCDGYAKNTYDDFNYEKDSYKDGYKAGQKESTCVIKDDLYAALFIDEFE